MPHDRGDGCPQSPARRTGTVTLLTSNGPGQAVYTPARIPLSGVANPTGLAVGDVNGDGYADVVVSGRGSDTLSVLDGGPSGLTPGVGSPVSTVEQPGAVALGDFQGTHTLTAEVASAATGDIDFVPQEP